MNEAQIAIKLEKLTKSYGQTRGIEDLSFNVFAGEVFGFLGPNGSGKTTAIRTILGLIKPSAGSMMILGTPSIARNIKIRNRIGYLPGIAATYENYTALGYLKFIARMRGLKLDLEIRELAARLNLDLTGHIHDLSKGNRQKVSLIQAFMHKPELLLLDEPTSGLDPLVQREFEIMLEEVKSRGAAVLLSSHILSEVEHLADRVAILDKGRAIAIDEVAALKARARRRIEITFESKVSREAFNNVPNIAEIEIKENTLACWVAGSERELLKQALSEGLISIRTEESSLEEIFLDLVSQE